MLKSRIVFFDTETTGADIRKDRIVELAYIKWEGGIEVLRNTLRLNPTIPIQEGASRVHGISESDIVNCPTFKDKCDALSKVFEGSYWCAYNGLRFDVPLIQSEFLRCNRTLKPEGMLDPMRIFNHFEGEICKKGTRTLMAAHLRYLNRPSDGAHGAMSDVEAMLRVTFAQMNCYPEIKNISDFSRICTKGNRKLDYRGFFKVQDEKVIMGLGKFANTPIEKIPKTYLAWMVGTTTLPEDARRIAEDAINQIYPII